MRNHYNRIFMRMLLKIYRRENKLRFESSYPLKSAQSEAVSPPLDHQKVIQRSFHGNHRPYFQRVGNYTTYHAFIACHKVFEHLR